MPTNVISIDVFDPSTLQRKSDEIKHLWVYFLAHHMTATFSGINQNEQGGIHLTEFCYYATGATQHPFTGILIFWFTLGDERFLLKEGKCLPRNGRNVLYFWLDPCKELLKILSNTISDYFWDLFSFTESTFNFNIITSNLSCSPQTKVTPSGLLE